MRVLPPTPPAPTPTEHDLRRIRRAVQILFAVLLALLLVLTA